MSQYNSRLSWLFHCYANGECTEAERKEFLTLAGLEENTAELQQLLSEAIDNSPAEKEINDERAGQLYGLILENVRSKERGDSIVKKMFPFRKLAIAASILIVFGIGLYSFLLNSKSDKIAAVTVVKNESTDIAPGRDNAILTLADGSTIVLDNAANGELAQEGNIKVLKVGGQISYAGNEAAGNAIYNTMSTARGNQYKLQLADGSKVWLNASSSIRFPAAFTSNERRVEITGEAYFEVAHNPSRPFIVKVASAAGTDGGEVQVLGTHFNVNGYDDEEMVKTTLLEGAVKFIKNNNMQLLKPGQQARAAYQTPGINISQADVDKVVAWKNGFFQFDGDNIENILRQISRWYDIDVAYESEVSKETFSGIVSRNSNIGQVLKILEAGGVKFKLAGRKIIVTQ